MFSSSFIKNALSTEENVPNALRFWTDSRTIKKDDIFVAISGENFDGHDFIEAAVRMGAVGAIVNSSKVKVGDKIPTDFPIIKVTDTVEALRKLAHHHRSRLKIPVISVGGSNGKTTTKEWIWHFLSHLSSPSKIYKTKKSENSILGIALNILQITDESMAVIEIGIDEPGWMQKHLELIRPTHGVVTTISEEHLERLGSIEKIASEELQLLTHLTNNKGQFAANCDCPWIAKSDLNLTHLSYGLEAKADIEGGFSSPSTLQCFGIDWISPLPGKHNAQNLLAALCVTRLIHPHLNMDDLKKLSKTTLEFEGEKHRSRWIEFKNKIHVFDDSYNANPDSMIKALKTFEEVSGNMRRHIILGDMLDLGSHSDQAHESVLKFLDSMKFEHLYLVGPNFESASKKMANKKMSVHCFKTTDQLTSQIRKSLRPNQSVFLKGSRGMALDQLLPTIEQI